MTAWLIAGSHFFLALLLYVIVTHVTSWLTKKIRDRKQESFLAEFAASTGISHSFDASDPKYGKERQEIIRFSAERYSYDLFRNRFSDLCGFLCVALEFFGLFGGVVVVAILVFFLGFNPLVFYLAPLVNLLCSLLELIVAEMCFLVSRRFPAEAMEFNKTMFKLQHGGIKMR